MATTRYIKVATICLHIHNNWLIFLDYGFTGLAKIKWAEAIVRKKDLKTNKVCDSRIYYLDLLSEESPRQYLENLDEYKRKHADSKFRSHLIYFQAKALVCISHFEEAIQLATNLLGQAVNDHDYYLLVKCTMISWYSPSNTFYSDDSCVIVVIGCKMCNIQRVGLLP